VRSVDGEEVGPVARRFDLKDLLDERQHFCEWRTWFERVVEARRFPRDRYQGPFSSSARIIPLRHLAAQLAPLERQSFGSVAPGIATATFAPAPKFPRPAHDLERLALADIDATELEPIGVRMLVRVEHVPTRRATCRTATAALDAVHLGGRDRERGSRSARWTHRRARTHAAS